MLRLCTFCSWSSRGVPSCPYSWSKALLADEADCTSRVLDGADADDDGVVISCLTKVKVCLPRLPLVDGVTMRWA
jgi:hypothetical protein